MNEMLIILITLCSILSLFIGGCLLRNLIVKVVEVEHNMFGDNFGM